MIYFDGFSLSTSSFCLMELQPTRQEKNSKKKELSKKKGDILHLYELLNILSNRIIFPFSLFFFFLLLGYKVGEVFDIPVRRKTKNAHRESFFLSVCQVHRGTRCAVHISLVSDHQPVSQVDMIT